MTCFHPKTAYEYTLVDGSKKLSFRKSALNYLNARELPLPCYWCSGCRADRQQDWATRIILEAHPHGDKNIFITLTYAPENLPAGGTLVKSDFQKFIRSLRKRTKKQIRYYMAGEYGNICTAHNGWIKNKVKDHDQCKVCNIGRPHYHVILFNYRPQDETKWAIRKGNQCFRSNTIEKAWQHGTSEYGLLTPASARYVAGYILKKMTGDLAEDHYRLPINDQGNYYYALPEYNNMSLKPGLGTEYYELYKHDIYPDDFVKIDDKKHKVPRYFDFLLKTKHPDFYEHIKSARRLKAQEHTQDKTPQRLAARERCHLARLKNTQRPLK